MTGISNVLVQHLSDDGTPDGAIDMSVDGSVTPQTFWLAIDADRHSCVLARAIFFIDCTGTITAEKFGNLTTLTNGIEFGFYDSDGNQAIDLYGGRMPKSNAEIAAAMYDFVPDDYGSGNNYMRGRLSFNKFTKGGIHLSNTETIKLTVNDDLTALNGFSVLIEGEYLR